MAAPASASSAPPPFSWPAPPPPCTVDDALGPLALSNWVLPGRLCVGGYPSALSNEKARQYAQAIVDAGLDTIVNLMQSNELSRFREYAGLMTHLSLRPMQFLSYPIGDGSIPKDRDSFLALIDDLLRRLQSGRKLYIHCWGGHGRTGTVLSAMLGAMYPARSADECLDLCQELHTARTYNGMHRSPEELQQKGFVRAAIERVRQIQAGTESWPPASLQGWTVANLAFTEYSPSSESANEADSSKQTKRQRILSGLPPSTPPRAGGGSGIIVVDSFGTASTTQALSSVPSTPLMSPAVRRISAEGLKLARDNSTATLLPRQMIAIDSDHAASSSSSSAAASSLPPPFTLLTMNTLADGLCDSKSFPHTDPAALDWSKRCELILDELTGAHRSSLHAPAPDILCLQEVDHFSDFYSPRLKDLGYGAGFFLGKADQTATSGDGVAIFVRPDAFSVRRIQRVSMAGMNQVALIVQLAPVGKSKGQSSRRLYVVTTHLKAKDGFEIVRLKQVQIIVHAVESFIARFHEVSLNEPTPKADAAPIDVCSLSNPPHASLCADFVLPPTAALVFAGDFNDTPDSAMFGFIAQGSSHIDTTHVGVKKPAQAPTPASVENAAAMTDVVQPPAADVAQSAASQSVLGLLSSGLSAAPAAAASSSAAAAVSPSLRVSCPVSPVRHSLWLHSLYNRFFDPAQPANHEGELYTTAKRRSILVQRCIDYIWFSAATLRPTHMLSIPRVSDEIPQFLPDTRYPSDHLAIAGRFEWNKL